MKAMTQYILYKNTSVYAVSGTNKAISDACLKFPSLGFILYPGDIKTEIPSEWGWGGGGGWLVPSREY
jgi:hypothetical protein